MKIELDLPEWCDERDIYIMAGIELAAFKFAAKKTLHLKTSRCNQCGKCCMNLRKNVHPYPLKEDGSCSYLIADGPGRWVCSHEYRAFSCCWSDPVMYNRDRDICSIRYDGEK